MSLPFPAYQPRRDVQWKDVRYRKLPFADAAVERYCEALRSLYTSGAVQYAAYEATNTDDFLSAYQFARPGDIRPAVTALLGSELVLEEFAGESFRENRFDKAEVVHQGPCQFEGLFADVLLLGGMYGRWSGSAEEAKALAAAGVTGLRTLAPDGFWEPMLVAGYWCSFFKDVMYDYTFVVRFAYHARWFVLCATDTD